MESFSHILDMIPGARKITINNTDYYWKISGGKSRYRGAQDPDLRLTVLRENQGRCMTADLFSKEWEGEDPADYPDWKHRVSFTPNDVRTIILYGLKHGWNPEIKGAAFDLNKVAKAKAELEFKQYELAD